MTAHLTPAQAARLAVVQCIADWLAKEYGELLDRDPPGYWEFQARELLAALRIGAHACPNPLETVAAALTDGTPR